MSYILVFGVGNKTGTFAFKKFSLRFGHLVIDFAAGVFEEVSGDINITKLTELRIHRPSSSSMKEASIVAASLVTSERIKNLAVGIISGATTNLLI